MIKTKNYDFVMIIHSYQNFLSEILMRNIIIEGRVAISDLLVSHSTTKRNEI